MNLHFDADTGQHEQFLGQPFRTLGGVKLRCIGTEGDEFVWQQCGHTPICHLPSAISHAAP